MAAGRSLAAALTDPTHPDQNLDWTLTDSADAKSGMRDGRLLRRAHHPLGLLQGDPVLGHRQAHQRPAVAGQRPGGQRHGALHQREGRLGGGRLARRADDAGLPQERLPGLQPDRGQQQEDGQQRLVAGLRAPTSSTPVPPSSTTVRARWPAASTSSRTAPRRCRPATASVTQRRRRGRAGHGRRRRTARQLHRGAGTLAGSAGKLAGSAGRLAGSAGKLAGSAGKVAGSSRQVAAGSTGVARGASGLADANADLARATRLVGAELRALDRLCDPAGAGPRYCEAVARARTSADRVAGGASGRQRPVRDARRLGAARRRGQPEARRRHPQLAGGARQLAGGARQLSGGAHRLAGGARSLDAASGQAQQRRRRPWSAGPGRWPPARPRSTRPRARWRPAPSRARPPVRPSPPVRPRSARAPGRSTTVRTSSAAA